MRAYSLIVGLALFILAAPVHAAALIDINTADLATLETLPHIGAALAQKIIDYRTQNGPFTSIEGLQKVSGIGSGSNYADIAPLITVGGTSASDASDAAVAGASSPAVPASSGAAPAYVPPPAALSVEIRGESAALLEVPIRLVARVTTKSGSVDTAARISWSFGDGSSGEGSVAEKTYRYAGTYLVVVTATDGEVIARDDLTVVAKPAAVRLSAITGEGITIANDSDERLELSSWRLLSGSGSFRIPDGMAILPHASALLPFAITNLPIAFDAALSYPNGITAARYAPPIAAQLQAPEPGSPEVKRVEPIISQETNVPSHEEAVIAPAPVSKKETGAGAALPEVTASPGLAAAGAAPAAHSSGLFSPWTLGLFGIMALAAGAFVLL